MPAQKPAKKKPAKAARTAKKAPAKKGSAKKAASKRRSAAKKPAASRKSAKKTAALKKASSGKKTKTAAKKAAAKRKATPAQKTAPASAARGKKSGYVPAESEKYMSKRQLEYFARMFESMHVKILLNNERLVDAIKDDVQALPDENDRASKESEFTVELRERERERRLLNKVASALQRIKNKNFGYCSECGDPIGLKRLLARPVATLCIECKNLQEAFEKSGSAIQR